ncbi:response regulator transcription factor [Streptomyces sp. OE57]|uniref:response regulator transcription factor n=1 Tax=Streptomyces lacaronensis TaxID=3379885 RepID=UPI0039B72FDE
MIHRHPQTAERLVRAVESAARHEGDIPSDLLTRLLTQMERIRRREGSTSEEVRKLSPRELSLLELVAKGLGTREIAAQLSYSERTVKGVLHGIMTRMHLKNRAHAVAFAIREGYTWAARRANGEAGDPRAPLRRSTELSTMAHPARRTSMCDRTGRPLS